MEHAEEVAALASMLVGLRAEATTLLIDPPAPELAEALISGLPPGARLVVLSGDAEAAETLAARLGDDLRVTVHTQAPEGFLHDVAAHRFELLILARSAPPSALIALAASRLAPGGLLVWTPDAGAKTSREPLALPQRDDGLRLRQESLPSLGVGLALLATDPQPRRRARRRGQRAST